MALPTPAPKTDARCWPMPCRDFHGTYAHASGEDPCACRCHRGALELESLSPAEVVMIAELGLAQSDAATERDKPIDTVDELGLRGLRTRLVALSLELADGTVVVPLDDALRALRPAIDRELTGGPIRVADDGTVVDELAGWTEAERRLAYGDR